MAVIEIVSTQYTIDNCICYERYLNGNPNFTSIRIVPNDGYCMKRTYLDENGETVVVYTGGYSQISAAMLAEMFPQYEAVLITSVPDGETIHGITTPQVTE